MIKTRCRKIFVNVEKHFKGYTCKEMKKPSVTKLYSVGFNHNPELPNKKRIRMIKPFWRNIFFKRITKHSNWLRKFWDHSVFHNERVGVVPRPINQKITKSPPIRVPSTNFLHPTHKSFTSPPPPPPHTPPKN